MFETLPCSVSKCVHKGLMQELHCLQLPHWLQFSAPEGVFVLVYISCLFVFLKTERIDRRACHCPWYRNIKTVHHEARRSVKVDNMLLYFTQKQHRASK